MTARILVEIAASIGRFEADFAKASKIAEQNSKQIQRQIDETKKKAEEFGRALIGTFGISLGVEGIIRAFETLKEKTIEGERALNQFNAVLKATGSSAGLTADALQQIGKGIENKSIFDDDAILAATTALLRFRDVQGEVFKEALELVPDVAAVLGVELPAAAVTLGRALSDPEAGMKALKSAGVNLSEQEKDLAARLVEAGNKAGAQRVVLDALRASIVGAGEADTKGLLGATSRLARAWGDLEKAAGKKLFGDNQPVINLATLAFSGLAHAIEKADLSLGNFILKSGNPALTALAVVGKLVQGEGDRRLGPSSSGKIDTRAADEVEATMAQARALQEQIDEQKYIKQEAALKRFAANAAVYNQRFVQQEKAALAIEQAETDYAYARGEQAASEHFAKLADIARRNRELTQADLAEQIRAQEGIINAPRDKASKVTDEDIEAAKIRVIQLRNQQAEAANAEARTTLSILQDQQTAVEKLTDDYEELYAKLAEQSGRSAEAQAVRFERENRLERRRINAGLASLNPNEQAAARRADALFEANRLQSGRIAALSDEEAKFRRILEEVAVTQERINLASESGALSELQALAQRSDANRARIAELQKVADEYARIAALSSDPADIVKAEQFRLAIERLGAQTDLVAKKFQNIFESNFANAFSSFIDGTKSAKDAFRDFGKSVQRDLAAIASKEIASAIFGKSGIGSGIGEWLAGLFSGPSAAASPGWTSGYDLPMGFAAGGSPPVGRVSIVGERGPELFVPKTAGTILPNNVVQMAAHRGGSSGPTIVQNITNLPGVSRASSAQVSMEAARQAQRAIGRNG